MSTDWIHFSRVNSLKFGVLTAGWVRKCQKKKRSGRNRISYSRRQTAKSERFWRRRWGWKPQHGQFSRKVCTNRWSLSPRWYLWYDTKAIINVINEWFTVPTSVDGTLDVSLCSHGLNVKTKNVIKRLIYAQIWWKLVNIVTSTRTT